LVASVGNGGDNAVLSWDPHFEKPPDTLLKPPAVKNSRAFWLVFRPDGHELAIAMLEKNKIGFVRLWDFDHPDDNRVLARGERRACTLAYSPNGEYLATGNDDGTVYILRLPPPAARAGP
jgi:WD40 repeat protein